MAGEIDLTPAVELTESLNVEEMTPDSDAPVVEPEAAAPEVVFDVKDLDVYYGAFRAVRDVNISVHRNEITAFIGPSGCGKTTVLRCFNRMNDLIDIARVEGSITYHGVDLYDRAVNPVEVRRRIGMVFQKPNPFPKSIYDNVAYGPKIAGVEGQHGRHRREGAARRGAVGRGEGPPQGVGPGPVRRPAAAPLHRPRHRQRPRGPPHGRALLGPRPDRHRRGSKTSCRRSRTSTRSSSSPTTCSRPARVSDRTAFFTTEVNPESDTRTGLLVECDSTDKMFSNPSDERTENYVTGRFG